MFFFFHLLFCSFFQIVFFLVCHVYIVDAVLSIFTTRQVILTIVYVSP